MKLQCFQLAVVYTHFFNVILLFCWFFGFYFIQLLQLVSLFNLFVVAFCPSKHSNHRFMFKISKNKSFKISKNKFLYIFLVTFYRNFSLLYLALNHAHLFSAVHSRSQIGRFAACLDIYNVLHCLTTLIYL